MGFYEGFEGGVVRCGEVGVTGEGGLGEAACEPDELGVCDEVAETEFGISALGGAEEVAGAAAPEVLLCDDEAVAGFFEDAEAVGGALVFGVVEEDAEGFRIRIRYMGTDGPDGGTEPFTIAFSEDREGFILYPSSVPEKLEYAYDGSRQSP